MLEQCCCTGASSVGRCHQASSPPINPLQAAARGNASHSTPSPLPLDLSLDAHPCPPLLAMTVKHHHFLTLALPSLCSRASSRSPHSSPPPRKPGNGRIRRARARARPPWPVLGAPAPEAVPIPTNAPPAVMGHGDPAAILARGPRRCPHPSSARALPRPPWCRRCRRLPTFPVLASARREVSKQVNRSRAGQLKTYSVEYIFTLGRRIPLNAWPARPSEIRPANGFFPVSGG